MCGKMRKHEAFLQHTESDGLVARFKEACDLIDIDINAALKS